MLVVSSAIAWLHRTAPRLRTAHRGADQLDKAERLAAHLLIRSIHRLTERHPTMRLPRLLAGGWLLLAATCACAGAAPAPPGQVLQDATPERMVIVERHGVRAPTKPFTGLAAQAWPDWPVAPGELTPHGASDMRLMGGWLRHDAGQGLLAASGCPAPGAVLAWADGHDHRTRESGDALLEGIAPGCGLTARHGPPGAADPLFDAVATGACPLNPDQARQAVAARLSDGLRDPVPGYRPALAALVDLLDPPATRAPCPDDRGRCFAAGANRLQATARDARLQGPLATGASLVEALGLEYDQGMAGAQLGWGRLTPATLEAIMPLRNGYTALTRANPAIATRNGALMADAVLAAIEGRPALPGFGGQDARMVVFLGHDTTLANLAGILGLHWTLPGQPDATPPGAALVFTVYRGRDPAGRRVKLALLYQTADQLRALAPLDDAHPPGRVELLPDACRAAGGCGVETLRRIVRAVVPARCGAMSAAP